MQPGRPVQPVRPQQLGSDAQKGFMANLGRAVGNFVSGGALNRDIQRQRDEAARAQAQADRGDILDAQQAQQTAEQAQVRAEREAERARDQRAMDAVDGLDVVRGRAIWNIQSGEIARRISERELEEMEKLKGIIVQEGCTALIFANGELVTTLSSGAYLFYKSVQEEQAAIKKAVEEAEKQLSEAEKRQQQQRRQEAPTFRQLGIVGEIGRGFNFLGRIVERFKQSVNSSLLRQEALVNYEIDEYDERFLRHLALGYTKEQITNLRGMPFGVKSLEKRQNELVQKLFPDGNGGVGVNATRLVVRAIELHILDIDNLHPDEE